MAEEMVPPWKRVTEQKYAEQEKRTAKNQSGRRQPNSGRLWHSRRDVVLSNPIGKLLIDNKGTEAESFRIERNEWKKLRRDSNRTPPGCSPGMQIDIQDEHLMVIGLDFYDELCRYILHLEAEVEDARNKKD
jgi:hypothetical protein